MSFQVEEQRSSHSGSSNGQSRSIFSHPSGEYTSPTFSARLQSFSNYPLPHKVNILDLAKYGYIYKSSDERSQEVLCVGCKKVIKSWEVGKEPGSQQFHEEGCPFLRPSSTYSSSVTDDSETVSSHDEQTKPLKLQMLYGPHQVSSQSRKVVPRYRDAFSLQREPTKYSEIAYEPHQVSSQSRKYELHQVSSRSRKVVPRYGDAVSLPPEPTKYSEIPTRLQPADRGRGRTTDVSQNEIVRKRQGSEHRSYSPSPSILSSYSGTQAYQPLPAFLTRSPDESLCLPQSFMPVSRHQDHQDLARPENPPTLKELLVNLNLRNAQHRLLTFERYWLNENEFKNHRFLVICGFYCLGFGDAVECFCCHVIVANWARNDNPRIRHIEMSPRCRFMKGKDCGDISLAQEVRTPQARRYRSTHSTHGNHSTASPHNFGLIFRPSVEGLSSRSEHSHHSSPGQSLGSISQQSVEDTRAMNPEHQQEPYNQPTQAMRERGLLMMDQFPCLNAANEGMREEREFCRNTNLRANNQQLAQSGLYFTGEGDRTKWLSGSGLENLLIEDDPGQEQCEYLLQQKSPAWVSSISAPYPGIQHRIFPTRSPLPPSSSRHSAPPRIRVGVGPPQQLLAARDRLLGQSMQTQPVQSARNMGFFDKIIKELEAMERERECKVCLSSPANILFQPCGHICACATCAERVNHCPVCRAPIWQYVQTYHS